MCTQLLLYCNLYCNHLLFVGFFFVCFQPSFFTFHGLFALTLALMDALCLKFYDSVLIYSSGSLFLLWRAFLYDWKSNFFSADRVIVMHRGWFAPFAFNVHVSEWTGEHVPVVFKGTTIQQCDNLILWPPLPLRIDSFLKKELVLTEWVFLLLGKLGKGWCTPSRKFCAYFCRSIRRGSYARHPFRRCGGSVQACYQVRGCSWATL